MLKAKISEILQRVVSPEVAQDLSKELMKVFEEEVAEWVIGVLAKLGHLEEDKDGQRDVKTDV